MRIVSVRHLPLLLFTASLTSLLLLITLHYFNYLPSRTIHSVHPATHPNPNNDFYHETHTSYKARLMKEEEYKLKLALLNQSEIESLSDYYHRNITLQWSRALLPPAIPIYSPLCFTYSAKDYKARISVVIIYYNEVLPLIFRTLTTIVHRTPPKYLEEVFMIDDHSDKDEREEIVDFAAGLNIPLTIARNRDRLGITDSRLYGIHNARGDVIVILDSHMEVGEMWVEPLLDILAERPKALAVPALRMANEQDSDLDYKPTIWTTILENGFGFISFGDTLDPKDEDKHLPVLSPSLIGCAFAAFKSTLHEYYPKGVMSKSWGVENSRIAMRTWLCGDGIYISGCSYVKHTNGPDAMLARYFKGQHGLWGRLLMECVGEILNFIHSDYEKLRLLKRIARHDEFEEYFKVSDLIRSQFDPSEHECDRDHAWYLMNIQQHYAARDHTDSFYVGEVRALNHHDNMCLDVSHGRVIIWGCRDKSLLQGDVQVIQFRKTRQIRTADMNRNDCFDTASNDTIGSLIGLYGCHDTPSNTQIFTYIEETHQIRHDDSDRCVDMTGVRAAEDVVLNKCEVGREGQMWEIKQAPWFI